MPARSALVPKYCLHKPSGRAYVRIRGKVIYVGQHGSADSKQEYGRLIAELAASCGTVVPTAPASDLTVVELCAAYLDFAEGYYRKDGRPTTHMPQLKAAIRAINEMYGTTQVASFGPLALRAIQQKMVAANASRRYVNQHTGHIKRMFKWGVSVELLPAGIFHALATVPGLKAGRTAARETEPVKPVADELVEATLPYLPVVVADMVRFQRLTGARPGEICQLHPCDVDRSGDVWEYRPATHKTQYRGRERVIYVGPQAQLVLLPYLLRDAQAHCFSPAESEQKRHVEQRACRKTRVQPSQRNRRKAQPVRVPKAGYTKDSYGRAIARGIVKANRQRTNQAARTGVDPVLLPHWHANQLRHSKATKIRRQFGLEAAQVSLGHARADVTQVYAERDAHLAVEVARKIG